MEYRTMGPEQIPVYFPRRAPDTHKGQCGRILLLCGSRGYTGAAALAAMGALRTGAGLVYLGVPEGIYAIEAAKLTEPVVFPLPEKDGVYAPEAVDALKELLPRMDAVCIGCGMGRGEGPEAVLKLVLKEFPGPVIVDADGINLLGAHKDLLRDRVTPAILTPHAGEFFRFSGQRACESVAVTLATELGCVILLKGNCTRITDGKVCYVNSTGNPGMAVGGCGDVLAGIIAALAGRKIPPLEAAAMGAWLHGWAGDVCEEKIGQYGMLPGDMLEELPRLLP